MPDKSQDKISVFVSYSHADTRPRSIVDMSRLGVLMSDIKHDLGIHDGRSPFRILRDAEGTLTAGDDIDATVSAAIDAADVGLVFLSRGYCRSENCRFELQRLLEKGKRVILVELEEAWTTADYPEYDALRDRLSGDLRVMVWGTHDGLSRRYGDPLPNVKYSEFMSEYLEAERRIVDALYHARREIEAARGREAQAAGRPEPAGSAPDAPVNVVMAAPTSDVKAVADRLERAYVAAGVKVLRLDRTEADRDPEAAKRCIALGDVFVQVLGAFPGRRSEALGDRPVVIAQHDIAVDAGIEVSAWVAADFDMAECGEEYAAFLGRVVTHRTSFEDFETYTLRLVKDRQSLRDASDRRSRVRNFAGGDVPLVSIDAAEVDADLRDRIKDALEKHVYVDCIHYETEMETLHEAVQDNDAIVLVYGARPEGQKRAKARFRYFRRLRRTVWDEQKQRMEIAFGDASPAGGVPCPSGPDIHVIRVDDDVDPVSMTAFLESLRMVAAEESRP